MRERLMAELRRHRDEAVACALTITADAGDRRLTLSEEQIFEGHLGDMEKAERWLNILDRILDGGHREESILARVPFGASRDAAHG